MKKISKFLCVICFLLVIVGCSSSMKVSTNDNIELEYGDDIDYRLLYDKSQSDEDITVKEVTDFDKLKLGEQKITVVFTNDDNETKEAKINVTVKDTRKPEITLKKEAITIVQGDKFDAASNIALVKDPVDGNIKLSKDAKITENGYIVDEKVDVNKPGDYTVKIVAYDKNGNQAERSYSVKVKQKPAEQQAITAQPNHQASNYTTSNSSQSTAGGVKANTASGTATGSQTKTQQSKTQQSTTQQSTTQQNVPVNPTPPAADKVYIAGSGKGTKYHSNPNCSNMKNPVPISLDDAKASGYTACKKCY